MIVKVELCLILRKLIEWVWNENRDYCLYLYFDNDRYVYYFIFIKILIKVLFIFSFLFKFWLVIKCERMNVKRNYILGVNIKEIL